MITLLELRITDGDSVSLVSPGSDSWLPSSQGAMKNSVYSNNPHTIYELKMAIKEYIQNVDRTILNTVFKNTVRHVNNVWRLEGDTLNIICNFLYCNHQVHRDFFNHPVYLT